MEGETRSIPYANFEPRQHDLHGIRVGTAKHTRYHMPTLNRDSVAYTACAWVWPSIPSSITRGGRHVSRAQTFRRRRARWAPKSVKSRVFLVAFREETTMVIVVVSCCRCFSLSAIADSYESDTSGRRACIDPQTGGGGVTSRLEATVTVEQLPPLPSTVRGAKVQTTTVRSFRTGITRRAPP